jgi:hypothetical protein
MNNTKQRNYPLKQLVRPDGEKFDLTALLYELPASHDYWLVSYRAVHSNWGVMTFTLTIPKGIAPTREFAEAILQGSVDAQVRSMLQGANARGRPLDMVWSNDGWILV